MIEAALAAGLASEGSTSSCLGVVPTPTGGLDLRRRRGPGAVISASHNPYADNGIKLFAPVGASSPMPTRSASRPSSTASSPAPHPRWRPRPEPRSDRPLSVGSVAAMGRLVVDSIDGRRLDGMRVVVDCANGARRPTTPPRCCAASVPPSRSCTTVPTAATSTTDCGSTHPEDLQVRGGRPRCHLGLAFDGDADRVLAVDETGRPGRRRPDHRPVRDRPPRAGCTGRRHRRGHGDDQPRVPPGDGRRGASPWSRPRSATATSSRPSSGAAGSSAASSRVTSSSAIWPPPATACSPRLQLLDLVRASGRPLSELAAKAMTRFPQVLSNVRVAVPARRHRHRDVRHRRPGRARPG
jgi:phosphoglucosamine mutase